MPAEHRREHEGSGRGRGVRLRMPSHGCAFESSSGEELEPSVPKMDVCSNFIYLYRRAKPSRGAQGPNAPSEPSILGQ